jgi:hypothetical protein
VVIANVGVPSIDITRDRVVSFGIATTPQMWAKLLGLRNGVLSTGIFWIGVSKPLDDVACHMDRVTQQICRGIDMVVMRGGVIAALAGGLVLAGSSLIGTASANPPGPNEPGYCGAHTSPLECWTDTGPATPGENAFINQVLSYQISGVPTERTRLLQIARGTCTMLVGGTSPNYIVSELAQNLGKSEGVAGQIFIVAQDQAC